MSTVKAGVPARVPLFENAVVGAGDKLVLIDW